MDLVLELKKTRAKKNTEQWTGVIAMASIKQQW